MQATIKYRLTESGRKADVLAGGEGKGLQSLTIERDDPLFSRVVELGQVGDGTIVLDSGLWLDSPSTAEAVLDQLDADRAANAAKKAEKIAAIKRADREVLTERLTMSERWRVAPDVYYDELEPRWSYVNSWDLDAESKSALAVRESAEAQAWIAELEIENEARRAAAEAERDEKIAAKAAKEAAAAAEYAARVESCGGAEGDEVYKIESGCLAKVPIYSSHRNARNWLAVISANPKSPGGLDRNFAEKCKGGLYYDQSGLSVGDAVEFGADYYSARGRKSPKRWYGIVIGRGTVDGTDYLVLRNTKTGKSAIKAGKKLSASVA